MKRILFIGCLCAVFAVAGCGKKDTSDVAEDAPQTTSNTTGGSGGDAAVTPSDSDSNEGSLNADPTLSTKDRTVMRDEAKASSNPILARSLKRDPGPTDEIAVVRTNLGTFTLRFFPKQAPLAVANFKGLAAQGYFNGMIFHRVMKGFMIQTGDPTATGMGGESLWGRPFKGEFHQGLRYNGPGVVGLANSGDPNANKSQFFVTVSPQEHLNDKHTVFAEVMEGMDVVYDINEMPTNTDDKPLTPIIIESVTIEIRGS